MQTLTYRQISNLVQSAAFILVHLRRLCNQLFPWFRALGHHRRDLDCEATDENDKGWAKPISSDREPTSAAAPRIPAGH
jgi:hypothetical protein